MAHNSQRINSIGNQILPVLISSFVSLNIVCSEWPVSANGVRICRCDSDSASAYDCLNASWHDEEMRTLFEENSCERIFLKWEMVNVVTSELILPMVCYYSGRRLAFTRRFQDKAFSLASLLCSRLVHLVEDERERGSGMAKFHFEVKTVFLHMANI